MNDILLLLGILVHLQPHFHNLTQQPVSRFWMFSSYVIRNPSHAFYSRHVLSYNNKDESEEMHSKRKKDKPVTGDVVGFQL